MNAGNANELSGIMGNYGEAPVDALSTDHYIKQTDYSTGGFQFCPDLTEESGISVIKGNGLEVGQACMHDLPCSVSPVTFSGSVFKFADGDGRDQDFIRVNGKQMLCKMRVSSIYGANTDVCVKEIHYKDSLSVSSFSRG